MYLELDVCLLTGSYLRDPVVVHFYGRTRDGQSVLLLGHRFEPYFHILDPSDSDLSLVRKSESYVRDEEIIPLEEAVRRLTSLPAANLKIRRRGTLKKGHFADLVVFDPGKVRDHAIFAKPHRYSTGVVHVFVNGVQVLKDGEHTGATPGRVVRGPGWRQKD